MLELHRRPRRGRRRGARAGIEAHRASSGARGRVCASAPATRSDAEEGAGVGGGDRAGVARGASTRGSPPVVSVECVVARRRRRSVEALAGFRRRAPAASRRPPSPTLSSAPMGATGRRRGAVRRALERTRADRGVSARRGVGRARRHRAASQLEQPEPRAYVAPPRPGGDELTVERVLEQPLERAVERHAYARSTRRGASWSARRSVRGRAIAKKAPGRPSDEPTTGAEVRREALLRPRREGS